MGFIWQKKQKNGISEEFLLRLANLEAKLETQKQLLDNLRGLVNRKLGNSPDKDESDNNINDDGLDELRKINRGKL